ncbi:MAG: hypothetical protein U9Q67_04345 [Patescibacteria group bacterium]|nr:hypothetical protein [Patescibacteria group bacterium]
MTVANKSSSPQDGDGYFSEDMKVEVGTFSLDTLDLGGDDDDKSEKSGKTPRKASKKK